GEGERPGGGGREVVVVTGWHIHGNYSLRDAIKVDANIYRTRRGRWGRSCRGFRWRRRFWRFIAGLRQEWRRFGCAKHREIDRSPHGTIDRTHLQPSGAGTVIRAGEEVEVLAPGVEGGRNRIGHAITKLMAFLLGQRINKNRSQMTGQIL